MLRFETANNCFLEFSIYEPIAGPSPFVNILFVHGYLGSADNWDIYPQLLRTHSRIIAVSLYSHGTSSDVHPPAAKDEDLESARDIIALMHSSHFSTTNNKYFVVGHSFGGRVAGLIASQDPDHVLGAILIQPLPVRGFGAPPGHDEFILSAANDYNVFVQLFSFWSATPPAAPRPFRPHLLKAWHLSASRAIKAGYLERSRSTETDRSSIIFEGIRAPLLFITGDLDILFRKTLEEFSMFKNTTPRLHCFYNRGHLAPYDDPAEFAKVIDSFIADNTK